MDKNKESTEKEIRNELTRLLDSVSRMNKQYGEKTTLHIASNISIRYLSYVICLINECTHNHYVEIMTDFFQSIEEEVRKKINFIEKKKKENE